GGDRQDRQCRRRPKAAAHCRGRSPRPQSDGGVSRRVVLLPSPGPPTSVPDQIDDVPLYTRRSPQIDLRATSPRSSVKDASFEFANLRGVRTELVFSVILSLVRTYDVAPQTVAPHAGGPSRSKRKSSSDAVAYPRSCDDKKLFTKERRRNVAAVRRALRIGRQVAGRRRTRAPNHESKSGSRTGSAAARCAPWR